MYDANKNNMWPQQHQQQFIGAPIPPHRPQCHQNQSPPHHHHHDVTVANQRLDNHVPQQQQQQQQPHRHNGIVELPVPSNPRASRNMAEKQRRDNLNANIATMASLVPAVSGCSKKLDKISILRLAAAFLRTQYTLGSGVETFLPEPYEFNFEQYIIENMLGHAGFLFVVTTSGKIVYTSPHIEHHLGHAQYELVGQSLYDYVAPEDGDELQRNLTPDNVQSFTLNAALCNGNEDSSNSSDSPASLRSDSNFPPQRRNFDIRMSQKAINKRQHGQYERLQISGQLRLAHACLAQENCTTDPRSREINPVSNDVVFVGIARLLKKRIMTEVSLLEASRDEYVTRHLVDGRIIFVDQRISVVAGYMTEEVSGLSAFKFMHKEDVRWTMIALRQMYDRGEGFGSSCYRLLSKTGHFIYLRTHGYLEFDKNTQTVESFVCVNTLVSEEEGNKLVKEMKERFAAVSSGPAKAMIAPCLSSPSMSPTSSVSLDGQESVEDPLQLEDAIGHLISDLPSPLMADGCRSVSQSPSNQFNRTANYPHGLSPEPLYVNPITNQSKDCNSSPNSRMSLDGDVEQEGQDTKISISLINVLSPTTETIRKNNKNDNDTTEKIVKPIVKKLLPYGMRDENVMENSQDGHEDLYVEDASPRANAPTIKAPDDNLAQKRAPRKRMSQNVKGRNVRNGKQPDDKNVSPSNNIDLMVTSTCDIVSIRNRGRMNMSQNGKIVVRPASINQLIFTACKRSRGDEELIENMSKRKVNDYIGNDEANDYYDDSASPNVNGFVSSSPISSSTEDFSGRESSFGVHLVDHMDDHRRYDEPGTGMSPSHSSIEFYHQRLNVDQGLLDSLQNFGNFIDNEGLEEDFTERMLNPSLDDPDPLKIFEEQLQTVMCNGKTIDEANVNQFTASDQAVNAGIRRSHSQLAKGYALTESQFNVLKRDLCNPAALQAHRENLTQLEAEHMEHKQLLKTLQQDHLNLQANVHQNVGV